MRACRGVVRRRFCASANEEALSIGGVILYSAPHEWLVKPAVLFSK